MVASRSYSLRESISAENNVAVRIVGRPFQKVQSGNPGGRPKGCEEVRELARSYTKEAIQTLALIMRKGKSEGARIAASNTLRELGWGRPLQQVEVKRSPLDGFTRGQLLAALETVERALVVAGDDSEKLVSELGRDFFRQHFCRVYGRIVGEKPIRANAK